jgi:hypothetical protein
MVALYTPGAPNASSDAAATNTRSSTTGHPEMLTELLKAVHHEVVLPYVCVDRRPLGGFGVLRALSAPGELAHLLRDDL